MTRIKAEYIKKADKTESIVVTLMVKNKGYSGLSDAELQLYSLNDTSKNLIGQMQTNNDGQAIFVIKDNPDIYKNPSGILEFELAFNGDNSTKAASKKLSFGQADLDISFFKKDDIKFIEVDMGAMAEDGLSTPIEKITVQFYIKGTFSLYNIGKEKTNELGKARIEFPIDMPGDTAGVLTIVAKVEEHKKYGSIESISAMNWGIPLQVVKEKQRGLGDTDAPLWMVYTLIILLSAVWFHYFYVIFMIIRIKMAR